jgi:hypothetical protein
MAAYYRNEYLFSEIYLDEITRQPEHADLLASLSVLRQYREYADARSMGVWQETYIHEVLAALGFNPQSSGPHLTQLYPLGSLEQPVSLCYAILPDDDLDNTLIGHNWAEKIIRALRQHGFPWGLLTNGKQWRIYHLDEPTPYETYLEIDLETILIDNAKDAYQIFHKFLKAENFVSGNDSLCQFDRFKAESQAKIDYIEKELTNALKQREEGGKGVLSDLCMGYVQEFRSASATMAGGDLDDEDTRKKTYHGAMLYMFRLLFLFYADARRLLSVQNHALLAAVEQRSRDLASGAASDGSGYSLWQQLEEIFVDIDQTYNGGLFSPQESEFTRFIEDTRIGDAYLANVILNLTTYRERDGQPRPISYRDMSVRHLGTLYEGLLEHKLFIAKEDTEVKLAKGMIQFIPVSQGGKLVAGRYLKAGTVYFSGDPSERKSTGSYYTPEYIVDYIVRNTVGEKLKEIKEAFLAAERANLEAYYRAIDAVERASLGALLEDNVLAFVRDKVLQLSVVDPAMGSGHFLVNATNMIANFITDLLNQFGIEGTLPSGTAYWRRWVVENCIYGVDINPLAVELAKLSIWILSMAKDQPLSFLNHHLKCGNSLVGARLEEIGNYPFSTAKKESRQLNMFERDPGFHAAVNDAIAKSRLIASRASTSLEDVDAKKAWLAETERDLSGYKAICNVHVGLYFGNLIDEKEYSELVENRDFNRAFTIGNIDRYFHWELEFPEICIHRGGFTCIICNPPYDTFKENAFFSRGEAQGTGNLFSHFIARQIYLNSEEGVIGFVVPLSFACGDSYEKVRRLIYQTYEGIYSSHYSIRPAKLFPGIDQRITIFFTKGKSHSKNCRVYSSRLWRWNPGLEDYVVNNPDLGYIGDKASGFIPKVAGQIGADLYNKISNAPITLKSLMDGGEYVAYYHGIARYWIKTYDFIPFFSREGEVTLSKSSTLGSVGFSTEFGEYLFLLLTNSSLFYYWWIARSDEFHVLFSDLADFGILNIDCFMKSSDTMIRLVRELMADYQVHSKRSSGYAGGKKIISDIFFPRRSLAIIHEIDDFIADAYGFNTKYRDFIKYYDAEFRTDE